MAHLESRPAVEKVFRCKGGHQISGVPVDSYLSDTADVTTTTIEDETEIIIVSCGLLQNTADKASLLSYPVL